MFARKRRESQTRNQRNLAQKKREGHERRYAVRNGVHSPVTRSAHMTRMMHFNEPLGETSPRVPEIGHQGE